jgi:ABC-type antimicrobial peptide transport system permease subunit
MDKLFILEFAFKNLITHRLRSILTLLGVIIGVSAIVFLISFAFGIERLVTKEVTGGDAFLLIDVGTGSSQIITLTDNTTASIKDFSGVKDVYGMASIGAKAKVDDKSMDVSFYGADPEYFDRSGIKVTKGTNLTQDGDGILVNTAFVQFWNAGDANSLGKSATFDIVIPKDLIGKLDNLQITDQSYKVIGIINDDSSPKVYADFQTLRKFGISNYSQLKVEVTSKDKVPEVRKQIENMGLKTQYAGDTVSQINQVFGIFRAILAAFGLITLFVAVLGMFNTLTISLLERIKEIALLKMLGMKKRDINSIFLTESVILGFSGGTLGLGLGIGACQVANAILNHYARSMGGEAVSVFYFPISFIITIMAVSLLTGFLTGLYPARRAVKIKALDVLRYE